MPQFSFGLFKRFVTLQSMAGNSIGINFRLSTFGESHGVAIGGIIDGCPAGLELDTEMVQIELDRRRPGQSKITTQRNESDAVEFLSGIFEGKTTGAPIGFLIKNTNQKSKDYSHIKDKFRPSHADYTYQEKFGYRDYTGGGRSSARETACRVVGGAVAKQLLSHYNITIKAYVSSVKGITLNIPYPQLDFSQIEKNDVRCPDETVAKRMFKLIDETRKNGDTVGGTISCVIQGAPIGLGEPVFDRLEADLAKAMLSINAAKGFDIGSGFEGTKLNGSEHNDEFEVVDDKVRTKSNNAGGVLGGISNGEDIYFSVAFKPIATIMKDQNSIDINKDKTVVQGKGRHDPCVLPRAVPIVESMAALVLADHLLRNRTVQL